MSRRHSMKCAQETCDNDAVFIVYWPGEEILACDTCTGKLRNLATAMGFSLSMSSVPEEKDNESKEKEETERNQ